MMNELHPAHLHELAQQMIAHFRAKWGDDFTDDDIAEIERYAFVEAKTTDVDLECAWYETMYAF